MKEKDYQTWNSLLLSDFSAKQTLQLALIFVLSLVFVVFSSKGLLYAFAAWGASVCSRSLISGFATEK